MENPLIVAIILNNNHYEETLACLVSLRESEYRNLKIILLNTRPLDDRMETIREEFPAIQAVSLNANLGYAGNNNIGIQIALEQGAEWVLLLNDDTVLDPKCISAMVQVAAEDESIGILGPMVYHFEEPDVIQSAGGRLGRHWHNYHQGQNQVDMGQFQSPREVEWISGCAILVRRTLIDQLGMLDANYFLYWEEAEWCIRAAKAHWKILHVPNAKLWHKGVKSNYEPAPYVTYYCTRNRLFTLKKHGAPLLIRAIAFAEILRTLVSWSVRPRWSHKREHRNAMWRGLVDFLLRRMGPMPS